MRKKIKFGLAYRGMWQSFGKYQPRADQLVRIVPLIIETGCFPRVETNGGAFEQVNLLYGEDPNKAVRALTKPFHEASIQTHMLDHGLNGLWMYPVPADVCRLMYKVKHAQGVDIIRIFCGLNEVRNIIPSIHYVLEAGMIPQVTLCITFPPVHIIEYYTVIVEYLIEAGVSGTCPKDMAGVGCPGVLGCLTKAIKERHPEIIIQYHGYSGPGLSMVSILEACENGADIIDVAMEPIPWEKVHPDVISVQAMLKDAGSQIPEINMKVYMKARAMTQKLIDDFLGCFMDSTSKHMPFLLLKCGLPGDMMGSMMVDLKGVHSGINLILKGKNEPELSTDDLFVVLFDEMEYVWPKLGYPSLVTPLSQYVKNVALMNVMSLIKGEKRWTMIDSHTWDMILDKGSRLSGAPVPEIIALAEEKGYEFTNEDSQKNYPDQLDEYRKEMTENGWDFGQDDEELFELTMHDRQYRDYKSGITKKYFEDDLQRAKDAALAKQGFSEEEMKRMKRAKAEPVTAMEKGQIIWEIDVESSSMPLEVGHKYGPDNVFCYIAIPWHTYDKVLVNSSGRVIEICAKQGVLVDKGEPLAYIERCGEPA